MNIFLNQNEVWKSGVEQASKDWKKHKKNKPAIKQAHKVITISLTYSLPNVYQKHT